MSLLLWTSTPTLVDGMSPSTGTRLALGSLGDGVVLPAKSRDSHCHAPSWGRGGQRLSQEGRQEGWGWTRPRALRGWEVTGWGPCELRPPSPPPECVHCLWTSLTKHRFDNKIAKYFKMVTAEHPIPGLPGHGALCDGCGPMPRKPALQPASVRTGRPHLSVRVAAGGQGPVPRGARRSLCEGLSGTPRAVTISPGPLGLQGTAQEAAVLLKRLLLPATQSEQICASPSGPHPPDLKEPREPMVTADLDHELLPCASGPFTPRGESGGFGGSRLHSCDALLLPLPSRPVPVLVLEAAAAVAISLPAMCARLVNSH